jgi:hypothetical protein
MSPASGNLVLTFLQVSRNSAFWDGWDKENNDELVGIEEDDCARL